jgi:epoxyqueuosine reductase
MDLAVRVKRLAFANDIDYVGIAPVERFENAPQGHRPTDILPGAESVVSMSIIMNRGPQLTQRIALANRKLRHVAFSYRWFAYGLLNMYFLDRAAFLMTKLLEEEGDVAVPIVASGVEDSGKLMAPFSNRHAAVAAGIGEIGWNGLCLTPDNGPRQRFVSVITTAMLEPDTMYNGPKICDLKKCYELGQGMPLCVKLCPLNAFSTERTVDAIIGERKFTYAWMDHNICAIAGSGLHPRVLGPDDMDIPDMETGKTDYADVRAKLRAKAPAKTFFEPLIYGRGHFCGICLLRCPVGASKTVDDIMESKGEGI